MRGVFDGNGETFNVISNNIKEDVLNLLQSLIDNDNENAPFNKIYNSGNKTYEILLKKAKKTALYIKKDSGKYHFTDYVKQINLNLLYGQEVGNQIRYSRDGSDYEGNGLYAKMHLKYDPFLFIIDAMALLGYIDNKIGNYDRRKGLGYRSRMNFTDMGRSLFCSIERPARFESMMNHDPIVKTKISEKVITTGVNKGKIKKYVEIVPYEKTEHILRKERFIKQVNRFYSDLNITVDVTNIELDNIKFLDELYLNYINNNIDISLLDIDIVSNCNKSLNTKLHSIDKLNKINSNIQEEDKRKEGKREGRERELLSLLMGISEIGCDNSKLWCQSSSGYVDDNLIINKLKLTIKKKSLHRVYSRNSWSLHGRWYGGL